MPLTKRRELKFWCEKTFKNTVKQDSGLEISVPDYEQQPTARMTDEVDDVMRCCFGNKANGIVLANYRICW
jgi:hypothetical protein